jgi:hypothetical protein
MAVAGVLTIGGLWAIWHLIFRASGGA